MKKRAVLLIDIVLVALTLLLVVGLVKYGFYGDGVLLSPEDFDLRTGELFRFFSVDRIAVSNDVNFVDGEVYFVSDGQVIDMKKGLQYMRLDYGDYYEVRKVELDEDLEFILRKNEDGSYSVLVSGGNYAVDVFEGDGEYRNSILWEASR